jgi:hypothetical protein
MVMKSDTPQPIMFHTLKTPLRILAIAIPGGMENFFDNLSAAEKAGALDDVIYKKYLKSMGSNGWSRPTKF